MIDPYLLPLAEASAAYITPDVPWFQNVNGTCQVYFSVVLDHPTFAFGGTRTFNEWIVDFMAPDVPFFQHRSFGPIHLGFWNDIQSSVAAIQAKLASIGNPSFLLAGHSKGAGEVLLAHAALKLAGFPPLATRSYEPPCVGTDELYAGILANDDIAWSQTFNATGSDIVTQVPWWPEWIQPPLPHIRNRLAVPDDYGLAEKHEIPAVLAAIKAA
jgi:hypothetical protein